MRQTPITIEQANDKLKVAIERQNTEEISKWTWIIKSLEEYRIGIKNKIREMKEADLRRKLKESYRL